MVGLYQISNVYTIIFLYYLGVKVLRLICIKVVIFGVFCFCKIYFNTNYIMLLFIISVILCI